MAKHVLVLYENSRLLPANIEGDRGLNQALQATGRAVDLSPEFLDYPRFEGEAYFRIVTTYLRDKYASHPPDVIVVGGEKALEFLLHNRSELFPGVPVVHMGVEKAFADGLKLPPDVRGVPYKVDYLGTIEQALRWHPKAHHLVIVTGAADPDRDWEALLRKRLPTLQPRPANIEFLAGLSTDEVNRRVGALGADAVVFTPGYFMDGAGRNFAPRESVRDIAAAAAAPVYGPYNTFIGTGVVGGRVSNFEAMGRTAGDIVNQVLDGRSLDTLQLPDVMPSTLSVDWRQIERWGIDQHAVPADAQVQFRMPGFWELYRLPALIVLAAFIVQSVLLGWLVFERARRRSAEGAADKHRFELAHASRLAVAGELTASIAHEINQPLGAILSNVTAARLLLEADGDDREDLRLILDDIRRDDVRASEVIRRLRALLEKHEVERKPLELNEALAETEVLLRAEARRRRVDLAVRPSPVGIGIVGDRTQIQQVLINLVLNAMDAVADRPEEARLVSVSVARAGAIAAISVGDSGHGIAREHHPHLFDSFFSTKHSGIGLGLSIVRTLVEAHGGRVWAENRPSGGAIFHVELPADAQARAEAAA